MSLHPFSWVLTFPPLSVLTVAGSVGGWASCGWVGFHGTPGYIHVQWVATFEVFLEAISPDGGGRRLYKNVAVQKWVGGLAWDSLYTSTMGCHV